MELQIKIRKKGGHDIKHEVFDSFCYDKFSKITTEQMEYLPDGLVLKLGKLKRGFKWIDNLSLAERLYLLWKVFKEPFYIFIRGNSNPVSIEDFIKIQTLSNNEDASIEATRCVIDTFGFVLSNHDLIDTMIYAGQITRSPAAKYLLKTRNAVQKDAAKIEKHKENLKFIESVIFQYERIITRAVVDQGISFSEWLVLLFLYDEKEKQIKDGVDYYKNTANASRIMLINAFSSLRDKGYVEKIGNGRRRTAQKITILGKQLVNKILIKYILNF